MVIKRVIHYATKRPVVSQEGICLMDLVIVISSTLMTISVSKVPFNNFLTAQYSSLDTVVFCGGAAGF